MSRAVHRWRRLIERRTMSHSAPIGPSGAGAAGRPAQPPQPARGESGRQRPKGLRGADDCLEKRHELQELASPVRSVLGCSLRWGATAGMATQIRFSTDDLPPSDRVRFWCDYFAKQAHSITPSEIPDPGAFRAEASGSVAGEFALLEIESGLRGSNAPRPTWPRTRPRRSSSADSDGRRSGGSPQAACWWTSFTRPAISA